MWAAWLAVAIVVGWLVGPNILGLPVEASVNGTVVDATANQRVLDVVDQVAPDALRPGDLLDVSGAIIKKGGGLAPTIWVGEREANDTDLVRWYRDIRVRSGEDKTEPTKVTTTWERLPFQRSGSGPIPVVTENGAVVPTEVLSGKLSGIEISRATAGEPRAPKVSYLASRGGSPKYVALTFDDGPNEGETSQILDILRREKVPATFFVLGKNAQKYPELVLREASEGHQVAMHSWSHTEYTKLTPPELRTDIARCSAAVEKITGFAPTWIRPPYGQVDGTVYTEITNRGLNVALWDVDPVDYSRPGMQRIINPVVYTTRPGSVVLMHDGGGNRSQTVAALPGIIGELRDAGYTFITIEQYGQLVGQ